MREMRSAYIILVEIPEAGKIILKLIIKNRV
jgi:hypothetical protein